MRVQKMVKQGIELIVGGRNDPQFGQLILFGLGGIFVEVLKDVSIRVCPIAMDEAREMISEIRGSPLLHGARGSAPVDTEKLAHLLVNVSRMLYENDEIAELDLNPVIAYGNGFLAVDVRMVMPCTH
jgi:acyl-CoA synthetase (NDP forming)